MTATQRLSALPLQTGGEQPASGNNNTAQAKALYAFIFPQGRFVGSLAAAPISGNAANAIGTNAGVNFGMRVATVDTVAASASYLHATSVLNVLSQPNVGVAYNAGGMTTPFNMVMGAIQIDSAFKQHAYAEKIQDKQAILQQRVCIVQSGLLTAAGASYVALRPLAIASAVTGASATSLLGRVTACTGIVGTALFSAFLGVVVALLGIQIYQGNKFQKKLAKMAPEAQVRFLQEQAGLVNPEAIKQKLLDQQAKKVYGCTYADLSNEDAKKAVRSRVDCQLKQEALAYGLEALQKFLKEQGQRVPSKTECCEQEYLVQLATAAGEDLSATGLAIRVNKKQVKNIAKLTRLTNSDCVKAINGLTGDTIADVVAQINQSIKDNRNNNLLAGAVAVLSAGAMTASCVLTAGIGAIIVNALMAISAAIQFYFDSASLKRSLESEPVGKADKKLLLANSLLCVASVATVVALMASGVVSFGIVPLILTLVLAGIWLGYNGYAYYKVDQKEKADPNRLFKLHREHASYEILQAVFAQLPVKAQNKVCGELGLEEGSIPTENDWKNAQDAHVLQAEETAVFAQDLINYLDRLPRLT